MWFILIVILFPAAPDGTPSILQPVAFTSEAKCQQAGEATLGAIKDAKLDSIAGVALACKAISNPVTEKDASK